MDNQDQKQDTNKDVLSLDPKELAARFIKAILIVTALFFVLSFLLGLITTLSASCTKVQSNFDQYGNGTTKITYTDC